MGKFHTIQIKFDKDYLNQLTEDPDSGVCKQNCKYHIALHPAQFTDFGQSIKDELGRKLGKYDDIFQGIMLGYEKVNLKSDLGVIGIDNCYVHVDIQADFFVFKPDIGMILKGVVTRTTKDHVGCLVYSTFNISLPKPEDDDDDCWLGKKASVQSEVLFKIIYVDLGARLPYITGELLSIVKDNTNSESLTKKKSKRLNKKMNFEIHDEEDNLPSNPKSKKNHRKVHAMDEPRETIELNGEIMEERKVTGKRKRASLEVNEDAVIVSTVPKKIHKKKNKDDELMENLVINYKDFDVAENEIKLEDNHEEEDYSSTMTKKKRKKSYREFDSMEHLELNYDDFQVEEDKIKLEDNHEEEDHSSTKTKKKRKKSHREFDSMENLELNYDDFQVEEDKIKLEDNHVEELTARSKKKRRESYNRGAESMEEERNYEEFAEEDNKNKLEDNYDEEGYSSTRTKKEHKKSRHNRNVADELVVDENESKFKENYEEENYLTAKARKIRKKSHKAEPSENLETKDEEFKIDIDEIKLEKEDDYSTLKIKKNDKKNLNKEETFEMTVEDLVREAMEKQNKKHKKQKKQALDGDDDALKKREKRKEKKKRQMEEEKDMKLFDIKSLFNHSSASLHSNSLQSQTIEETTPKSKEKRKLGHVPIKTEKYDDYWDKIESKKPRKEKQRKSEDGDKEILSKINKRREKMEKQEIDDSLESLDLKRLFDGSTVTLNSSYSHTMANDEDRGKKRRKSKSVSQEVCLDEVKLEEDSELEKIISGKKRNRSKSVPR